MAGGYNDPILEALNRRRIGGALGSGLPLGDTMPDPLRPLGGRYEIVSPGRKPPMNPDVTLPQMQQQLGTTEVA